MLNDFKRQVVELLMSFETGDRGPLATINPDKYIQHNLRVADGLAGFRARLEAVPRGLPRSRWCVSSKTAILSLPIPNTISPASEWALIFSDLKAER